MAISIEQYRVAIGLFHRAGGRHNVNDDFFFWNFIFLNFLFCHLVLPKLILTAGDIETNPGPINQSQTKTIEIGHVNIRSLTAKVSDPNDLNKSLSKFILVRNHVQFYHYDVFGISETWLDESIPDADLLIPGYRRPFRRDVSRHQCGVLVYVSENIPAKRRKDIEPHDAEIICIEVQTGPKKILISNCYRAPHHDSVDFCSSISDIITNNVNSYDDMIFLGDMNGRNTLFWGDDITNTDGRILQAFFHQYDFGNMIHEPTRIVENHMSCIDLIFTNSPFIFTEVGTRDKIVDICDHCPVYGKLLYDYKKSQPYKRSVWNFKNGDYDKFRNLILNAPWLSCYDNNNVDNTVQNFMNMLLMCAEACIPHYEATIRPGDKRFMNSDIRRAMRHRDRLKKACKHSDNDELSAEFRRCKNEVLSMCRKAEEENQIKQNTEISVTNLSSRKWWKLLKGKLSTTTPDASGPIFHNGAIITNNNAKCELFNEFFVSQSYLDESSTSLPNVPPHAAIKIEQLVVQPEYVYKILSQLDTNKATGPDGIGNLILREASVPLAEPLANLFNYCISLGYFPDIWKIANVLPLYKKDDPMIFNNYRPISLLPCISKVFERILFNHIFTFLKRNNLINKSQSGFIPGDSTVNQLLAICDKLYKCVDDGDEMISVFLDLTKAFDRVWHKGLIYKLENIGICGKLLELLKSYLHNRKQFTSINGCSSTTKILRAGVPQGSVLGPLLFLIYINDISDNLISDTFLFADDSSLFQRVHNGNVDVATRLVNRDLCEIERWTKQWLISINIKKTVVMLFSRKRSPSVLPPILLDGCALSIVNEHKQLGLTFNSQLTWSNHISNITSKCNRIIGMITRYKYLWSRSALEVCYKSYVRPILEYCDILYDNCTLEDSQTVESVQLGAARLVTGGKKRTSHQSLYRELGWSTLQSRRMNHRLIKMYDILNNNTPSYLNTMTQHLLPSEEIRTRSHECKRLVVYKCNTVYYRNFFTNVTVLDWNKLDTNIKNSTSRLTFKYRLGKLCDQTPLLFNHNTDRSTQVTFTQIRMGFSNLKYDLFSKGCVQDSKCSCGADKEDARHFFFHCPLYAGARHVMITDIFHNLNLVATLPSILYGNSKLSTENNMKLFHIVYKFIQASKRF